MTQENTNPFHEGERFAQARTGAGDVAAWAGGFVRSYMPKQHRDFYESLPFLILSGEDENGQVWTTLVEGKNGFIQSPDSRHLTLKSSANAHDPLAPRFRRGGNIGGLGIELANRRRNRFSGTVSTQNGDVSIEMRQTFGNCPQYIHARSWRRVEPVINEASHHSDHLSEQQINTIRKSDTLFIGSGHQDDSESPSNGYDASHRGGAPGFVHVANPKSIQIPDYAGNNFFNTIGNLVGDPRVGLLFVDFETGSLLHLTGTAQIDWSPERERDPNALRTINVTIEHVIERPGVLSLRWQKIDTSPRKLRLAKRVQETEQVASFHLEPADGRPLNPFQAGQHLPIVVHIPGQQGLTLRTYSLSGAEHVKDQYRISIKREDNGLLSRFLHDEFREKDMISALHPAGSFVVPDGNAPVVLVSAGVGVTPMVSMLHTLAKTKRTVWFVHSTQSSEEHAFRQEVETAVARHENLHQRIFYTRPLANDAHGTDFDTKGRMNAESLLALNAGTDAHYMICGPNQFTADIQKGLESNGISADQIHSESFGPSKGKP